MGRRPAGVCAGYRHKGRDESERRKPDNLATEPTRGAHQSSQDPSSRKIAPTLNWRPRPTRPNHSAARHRSMTRAFAACVAARRSGDAEEGTALVRRARLLEPRSRCKAICNSARACLVDSIQCGAARWYARASRKPAGKYTRVRAWYCRPELRRRRARRTSRSDSPQTARACNACNTGRAGLGVGPRPVRRQTLSHVRWLQARE